MTFENQKGSLWPTIDLNSALFENGAWHSELVFFSPGLRGRLPAPPLGHFPQGQHSRSWEGIALEENDLGGLRLQPRLDCRRHRRGCPVSPFFASTALLGVLPGEERAHPARPFWRFERP
jgi:hypothetical protein